MNNKDSFDQLFDQWMAPETVEDAGFSQRVLKSLDPAPRPYFSWNLIFLCLSLMIGFVYFRWDLVLLQQYLIGLELLSILSQVEISSFTVSVSPSLFLALVVLVSYFVSQKFLRLIKNI